MVFGLGEAAALTTAASWAGSCQLHTVAGRMVGAVTLVVARFPLFAAATALVVLLTGTSTALTLESFVCIMISGALGVGISDPFLYSASITIGPRLATLLLSLSACITALLGNVFLGEHINLMGWIGILVATSGVAFVLIEGGIHHGADFSGLTNTQVAIGVGKGLMAAACLASSLLFLKQALLLGIEPFWGSFLRICAGGGVVWMLALARGRLFRIMREVWTSWPVMRVLLAGCAVSTVGNCLAPVAVKFTYAGIAATLIGLQPIMIIIITTVVERKRPSGQAIIGTLIAFGGTALIFLR
ncbi:MAG: DMT family transporter [Deltaproteobacteria bacterium]|nr:DMT family transporter [Deltaproteobacteria bacterium]